MVDVVVDVEEVVWMELAVVVAVVVLLVVRVHFMVIQLSAQLKCFTMYL